MGEDTRTTAAMSQGSIPRTDLIQPARIGAYRLLERLGRGGMGEVYRAVHEVTERPVALKVVNLDDQQLRHHIEQVTREAMAMASLRDAHVVTCYSFGEDGRKLFLALELMAGGDTARMVEERGQPLDEAMIRTFAISCALGLAAIHRIGLVHRDIKPSNILLDAAGNAKLGDFGLARFRDGVAKEPSRSGAGTPAYMPPEAITGSSAPDIRSDIYSLGVTMYFWATGVSPYRDSNNFASLQRVLAGDAPPLCAINPRLSADLIAIIARAMDPLPERRFQDPAAMLAALHGQEQAPPAAPAAVTELHQRPAAPRPPPQAPSRPLLWVALAAGAVAVALLLIRPAPAASAHEPAMTGHAASADGPAASATTGGYRIAWLGDSLVHFHENGSVSYTHAGLITHLGEESWLDGEAAPALTGLLASAGDFSVELAIHPANLTQEGPARIFCIGLTPRSADVMLGQSGSRLEVRVRTTATNPDGTRPSLVSDEGILDAGWHHVIFIRSGTHHALYLDGALRAACEVPGDLSGWDPDYPLSVGNDHRGGFPWSGAIERLVLGARAWSEAEVASRFKAWQQVALHGPAR